MFRWISLIRSLGPTSAKTLRGVRGDGSSLGLSSRGHEGDGGTIDFQERTTHVRGMSRKVGPCPVCDLDAPHHDETAHRLQPKIDAGDTLARAVSSFLSGESGVDRLHEALIEFDVTRY